MKTPSATAICLLMIPAPAAAQSEDGPHWGQAYAFVGESATSFPDGSIYGLIHSGAGAEILLVKGLAVGGEIGGMQYNSNPGWWGVFSLDPSYHFLPRSSKSRFVPFVACGYTRMFGKFYGPPDNLFNFGAGFHYWGFRRAGLRLEFRDHYLPGPLGQSEHYWELRIGLAFR